MNREQVFKLYRKKIEDQQLVAFKNNLKENMTKSEFDCNYLNTFLGKFLSTSKISKDQFVTSAHSVIDNISLCAKENTFLHKLVDYQPIENYVDELIKFHHENFNTKTHLSDLMLKCLEASKTTSLSIE